MMELFRFFRLGVIGLVGITVPGILMLLLASLGLLIPMSVLILHVCHLLLGLDDGAIWQSVATVYEGNRALIITLVVVGAYVAGYTLRLSTPDDLDLLSARRVIAQMGRDQATTPANAAKADAWPYRGEPDNKYPYLHFREYLLKRQLPELAALVKWGYAGQEGHSDDSKRTKTLVSMMKLDILDRSRELSAIVESNEAHVRLVFGTWKAIVVCRPLVLSGLVASILGLALTLIRISDHGTASDRPFILGVLVGLTLLGGMSWAKSQILNLFHYQRVRELTHIVGCLHYAQTTKSDAEKAV